MKHSLKITSILLFTFLLAQFIGLGIIYQYIDPELSKEGEIVFKDLPFGERPPLDESTSYILIILALVIGTVIFLIFMKLNWTWVLRIWFLFAVFFTLTIAFGAFIPVYFALFLALLLALWKIFKPNFWVQNLTELFIYGGLAAIFVPLLTLLSAILLLVFISGYDAYAVWKSKHMIKLAQSQAKAKLFAGLLIPYQRGKLKGKKEITEKTKAVSFQGKETKMKCSERKVRTAVLGGGDLGFPLIFAGVILVKIGLWASLVIPFFAALGLAFLLWYANEKKYYPAMPFISTGCFLGLIVVWLVKLI